MRCARVVEAAGAPAAGDREIGDVLFAAVNLARMRRSTPSSRCATRALASATGSPSPPSSPRPRAEAGTISPSRPALVLRPRRPRTRKPMSQIQHVHARQILDSRGNPTVEVELTGRVRGVGPCRGSVGRLDGRVRGHRAARRRRSAGWARASPARSTTSTARSQATSAGWRRPPGGARPHADLARRHPEQVAAGRQRDPRRVAGRRARVGGRGAPAAVALSRWRDRAHPAGADDERAQRRRARRQLGRLPGVHDRAGRRRQLLGGAADGRRGVPRVEADPARAGARHDRRRRGRVRAGPGVQRAGAGAVARRDRRRGLRAGRAGGDRARPGGVGAVSGGRGLRARARGPYAVAPTS